MVVKIGNHNHSCLKDCFKILLGNFNLLVSQKSWLFQAMAKDPKNHYQETPKQIRQKILKFISIPEQFAVYVREKGLLNDIQLTE